MATLAATVPTLSDVAKRTDPSGKIDRIVELLAQTNPIIEDAVFLEGNLPTGHRTTVRSGLPTVGFRRLNEGVTASRSTTAQIDEGCAIMEAISEVDVEVAALNGNQDAFRLSEAQAQIEAMNQLMVGTMIYGDAGVNPERFTGIMPRYNSLSGVSGQNIVNGAGAGSDNGSILLVVWGPNTAHCIYPKGSQAGIVHENMGEQLIQTSTTLGTGRMKALVDRWVWKCGFVVKDWRFIVRGANIDISNLVAESSNADVVKMMVKMLHRVPALGMGRPVFYVPRSVREMLDIQALSKASSQLTLETFSGKRTTAFQGVPIRTVDQMLETEATVA
jgi:hypothetical protein